MDGTVSIGKASLGIRRSSDAQQYLLVVLLLTSADIFTDGGTLHKAGAGEKSAIVFLI